MAKPRDVEKGPIIPGPQYIWTRGPSETTCVRLKVDMAKRVDDWARAEGGFHRLTRPEACRRLIALGLAKS